MATSKQVFWDIQDINNDMILKIDETLLEDPIQAINLQSLPNFEVGQDDTDQQVVMVTTSVPVKLTFNDYTSTSVVADFWGTRPIRK